MRRQRVAWPVLTGILFAATPSLAQDMRAPMILTGGTVRAGGATGIAHPIGGWPTAINNPSASWTEVAFPDGTSIVLERGADLVLQSVSKDPTTGRWMIQATSTKGHLRIAASDDSEVQLTTGGATVRIPAASAVISSGPDGSATLLSSGQIEVQHNGRTETIRRPSFSILFADGGPQRQSNQQLATLIDAFAPVLSEGDISGSEPQQGRGPSSGTTPVTYNTTPATTNVGTGSQQNNSSGPGTFGQTPGAPTSSGPGVLPVTIATNPPPVTPTGPRTPQSFALALGAVQLGGPSTGSTIAAPSANSISSNVDDLGFRVNGELVAEATVKVERTAFGTGRVRRFTPDSSGFPATTPQEGRNDNGLVQTNGSVAAPVGGYFQNLTASQLATSGTFYDALAKVGSVKLFLFDETAASNGNPVSETTLTRLSITDTSPTVADPSLSVQRPYLFFVPAANGQKPLKQYFGSAVFETGVQSDLPTEGQVGSLAGATDSGRIVFVGNSASFPNQLTVPEPGSGIRSIPLFPNNNSTSPAQTYNTSDNAPMPATVYIIDKIHQANPPPGLDNSDPRGIEAGERYFIIGGTAITPVAASRGLPGAPPGTVTRFAISDGLDPQTFDGSGTKTIAQQFVAPGATNQPGAFNHYNALRPEETFVAGAPRGDTHLLVISTADGRNPALRTDFQIAANGASSASASVGGINNFAGSLALAGATVGSAQLDPSEGAVAISANLGSLGTDATGLGAHMFPLISSPNSPIGYFAISQADEQQGAPGTPAGVQPGSLQAVGSSDAPSQFGYTRLATNVGTLPSLITSGAIDYSGFAAGFAQTTGSGTNTLYGLTSAQLGDVRIVSSGAEFTATLTAQSKSVGEVAWDPAAAAAPNGITGTRSVSFGTPATVKPTTAIASPATFAGVVPGKAAMASVDADVIQGVANRAGTIVAPGTNQVVNADLPASNEHLAWGFFLGDVAAKAAGTPPDRVNLGFWVAGRPVSLQALQSLTGTATYAGGMVGNVVQQVGQQAQLKTAVGQFAEQWNFSNRTGSINANFDGAQWNGVVASMPAGSQVFTGSGISGNNRALSVQGAFFHATPTIQTPATALSAANTPSAVGGIFGIRGAGYGANGILVGGRR